METQTFIGRKNELDRLKALHKKKTPNLVVVKGRRRVGKSRLGEAVSVSMVQNVFPELTITTQDLAAFDPQDPDTSLFALIQKNR